MRVENILNRKTKKAIQAIYDKYQYFPTHLINQDEDNVPHYVIGTGGDGKTYGELLNAIDHFMKGGITPMTAYLVPTKDDVEDLMSQKNIFEKIIQEVDQGNEHKKYKDFIVQLEWSKDIIYHNGKPFMRLYSKNQHWKYKPQDHSLIGNVVEDESQRERYLPNELFKTMDLLATLKRKKKPENFRVVFTSNAISLNAPFLVGIGCLELDDGIITLVKNKAGKVLAKVWNWKRPYDDVKKQHNNDVFMDIFEETGYAEYRYGNEFKNDDHTNIVNISLETLLKKGKYLHTLKVQEMICDVYYIDKQFTKENKSIWYFRHNNSPDAEQDIEYALNQDDASDKVKYKPNMSLEIARRLQRGKIYYDSIATKQSVRSIVKRWI